jgi:hypothetical protein
MQSKVCVKEPDEALSSSPQDNMITMAIKYQRAFCYIVPQVPYSLCECNNGSIGRMLRKIDRSQRTDNQHQVPHDVEPALASLQIRDNFDKFHNTYIWNLRNFLPSSSTCASGQIHPWAPSGVYTPINRNFWGLVKERAFKIHFFRRYSISNSLTSCCSMELRFSHPTER